MLRWLANRTRIVAALIQAGLTALIGAWLLSPSSPLGSMLLRTSYDSYYAWFGLTAGRRVRSQVEVKLPMPSCLGPASMAYQRKRPAWRLVLTFLCYALPA
jgi:hypothetical protein